MTMKMDASTFREAPVVAELGEHWISVKLDLTETNAENDAIIANLGIQSLPTLTLLKSDGDLTKKLSINGYTSGEELLKDLQKYRGE